MYVCVGVGGWTGTVRAGGGGGLAWGSHLFLVLIVSIAMANSYSLHDVFTYIYSVIADFFFYGKKYFIPHKSIIYTLLYVSSWSRK